jgi:hypothetical protein
MGRVKRCYAREKQRHRLRWEAEFERRGGCCQECAYRGPHRHYHLAHVVPIARSGHKRAHQITRSDKAWHEYVAQCRFLCLFCHADETVEQRDAGLLRPRDAP